MDPRPLQQPLADERSVARRTVLFTSALAASLAFLEGCAGKRRFVPLASTEPTVRPREAGVYPKASGSSMGVREGAASPWPTSIDVVPRREWTREAVIASLANPMNGVNRITVHHDAIRAAGMASPDETVQRLNNIRKMHLAQSWADIGYHFIIDPRGRVWEGRPIQYQGAHVKLNNEHNLGIMCMGNFDDETPSQATLTSLDTLLADRMRAYRIPTSRVFTHQEINPTACPGRNLQAYMRQTRSNSGRLVHLA